MNAPAYLDYAATAPIDPAAVAAMTVAAAHWANPSSVHRAGRAAHAALEDAREGIARGLGCQPSALVFTSGGTEALGLALNGVVATRRLVSAVEHDAVRAQAAGAEIIPVDGEGRVDLDALEKLLAAGPALVAVMQANNETGALQPLADVQALVHAAGGRLLVDAVQGAGKIACPHGDFVAVSAHKLGGPPGVGALIARCAEDLVGVQRGGGQERGFRAGTENLPGIAGFAAALVARTADAGWQDRVGVLRDRLETRLRAAGAIVHGAGAPRLPTISNLAMPGVAASTQVMALDLAGFAVSAGAACSSGKVTTSHVLTAMGIAPALAGQSIRVSLGWLTTEAEIDGFAAAWEALAARQASRAA
ncbi:cysteine desulfurase [Polymorphobacter arshaanensis]|uniref:Cysteine desulfurase n=1 Tax=Glacieibacterium arshaanense TaxID=2511025 RepID=A0A4Y9ENX8_9SPHN|nr:cysteine desulfurase family protein [Polymorphobacter arshaanensis]TFU03314.1 cysteine desulfurase [Polymorphobacter arshaanensis]